MISDETTVKSYRSQVSTDGTELTIAPVSRQDDGIFSCMAGTVDKIRYSIDDWLILNISLINNHLHWKWLKKVFNRSANDAPGNSVGSMIAEARLTVRGVAAIDNALQEETLKTIVDRARANVDRWENRYGVGKREQPRAYLHLRVKDYFQRLFYLFFQYSSRTDYITLN